MEDVIRATESDFAIVECFDPLKAKCSILPGCALKKVLSSALEAFYSELRKATIAQITEPNHAELVHLFQLNDPGRTSMLREVSEQVTARPGAPRGVN